MRTFGSVLSAVVILVALQFAAAQPFSGTFVSAEAGLTLTLQQDGAGALTGSLTGPNGQFAVQGEAQGANAYGVAESQQGPLGFQAQVSPDGAMLQIMFFQVGADGQPAPAGPMITLQRQGAGGGAGMPGAPGGAGAPGMPGGGGMPGGVPPGGMPGGGGTPGGAPGGPPTGFPPQPPAGGQPPAGFPQMPPLADPPPVNGFPPPAQTGMPDWNGTFVGNNGATALVVQGAQNSYAGYIQDQGQQYQFEAHIDDATLHGAFMVNGAQYEFWADRNGPTVTLYLGNTTYVLQQR